MLSYPAARRSSFSEVLHGVEVADPYRWMEQGDSDEVTEYVATQNALSRPILAALPSRETWLRRIRCLQRQPRRGCPFERNGKVFAWHNDGENQDRLVVADSADQLENARTVLDVNLLSDDGTVSVPMATVSPDGRLVAYGVADGGSDWRTIRVRDVDTGVDLDDEIRWTKFTWPVWLADGRSFTYWRYDEPIGDALSDQTGAGRLMVHTVGTPADDDHLVFSRTDEPRLMASHGPRHDDWFVVTTRRSSSAGNDLSVRRHDDPDLTSLVTGYDHRWRPLGIRNGRLLVLTDNGATRFRLVTIDLDSGHRSELIAEHRTDVLVDAHLTATGLVLEYSHDATSRVVLARNDGTLGDALPLGEGVSATMIRANDDSSTVYVQTATFATESTRHVVEVCAEKITSHRVLPDPTGTIAPADMTMQRLRVTSSDGSDVPAFLVHRSDVTTPAPTLIWGYGGFNVAMVPHFRPLLAAWIEAGGVLVVPNLRGGGEFGSDWHRAGTGEHKQQVFDDLYAVADYAITAGITTPKNLALHGRSNGGLLAGAALTQRPDLWAAVLPAVGVLDMLRFHRFTIGWAWTSDYGDPDDPKAFAWLRAYSPLHNVRADVDYPATLITTGDHDDRVVPAHSLKFAAELQHALTARAASIEPGADRFGPVFLAVDTRAGHGMGKPATAAAEEYADQLAFAAHYTGLTVPR